MKKEDGNHNKKKSVLAKVKEKAKKLRNSLRGKKHSNSNESRYPAPCSSARVDTKVKREEEAEYHSARMYDSKQTPGTNKHQAPSDPSVVVDTKNQTPPEKHEFPDESSRFPNFIVSTSSKNKSNKHVDEGENMKGESLTRDKGVSVKEYLMHKFEPGENERALSKAITQAISPRRDKMRVAMSSFLKTEESSDPYSADVDDNTNVNLKSSKSLPVSNTEPKTAPIKQSYSLGSNASKASLNLNQTFKSTFASYQDHFLSSSSNHNSGLKYSTTSTSTNTKQGLNHINSPGKTSSSALGHATNAANETQDSVSSDRKTRGPGHKATSVRRVPVSRANKMRVPVSTTNGIDGNATRTPLTIGAQGRFR